MTGACVLCASALSISWVMDIVSYTSLLPRAAMYFTPSHLFFFASWTVASTVFLYAISLGFRGILYILDVFVLHSVFHDLVNAILL